MPGITNAQNLNRYSYVRNNPLRYIDPTGHSLIENQYGGGCSISGYCGGSSNNNSGSTSGNGGGSDGGGGNYCTTHPNACGNSGGDGGSGNQGSNTDDEATDNILHPNEDNDTGEELTNLQLFGQVVTYGLIETTILLPIDFVLVDLTLAGGAACLDGIVVVCAAEIPIGAVDVVVADFQISLGNTIAQNVATGTRHEFEWIIIPQLLAVLTE